ncbi:MAG: STAS domain-containing protein [Pseudomonadota bacterium]|uniref:STAS domain-containing protein n=1 Tax=Thermithiobacillus tepidarius TaxID=929 RepID=UPI0004180B92|nr:STAS domain-containing protein [Thermithiobacillus tepidarius]
MASNIPILQIGRNLIVPIQGDLYDQLVLELQSDILNRIEKTAAAGLILDISALDFVDSFMARVLNDIATMAGLMGTRTVVVGLSPAIAMILMELGLQLSNVPTARNLEKGLKLLAELLGPEQDKAGEDVRHDE